MMKTFGEVKINIPLLDAIKQIPTYAKFLKDLCTQKRNGVKSLPQRVYMAEQSSATIQSAFPRKYVDPGSPTIPCIIGEHQIDRALLDLGAGVNVIPFATYENLGLGNLQPTPITLELADRSVRVPRGVVMDVLVKVEEFIFPVDFVVLDVGSTTSSRNKGCSVILGRPFLATANATINCRSGSMKISFGNMNASLNVFHMDTNEVNDSKDVYSIDGMHNLGEEITPKDSMETWEDYMELESFDFAIMHSLPEPNLFPPPVETSPKEEPIPPDVLDKTPFESPMDYEEWDSIDEEEYALEMSSILETIKEWDELLRDPPSPELEPLSVIQMGVGEAVEETSKPMMLGRGPKKRKKKHNEGKRPHASPVHPQGRKPRPRAHVNNEVGEWWRALRDLVLQLFVQYLFTFVSCFIFIFKPRRRKALGKRCSNEPTKLVGAAST